ncbi:unnamed protein product [Rotaria sordida]|uniref:Uncharacterized protein n=2 Tax=Rotaria sordida TaxID=392033 RepID=A0A814TCC1_9BILA|nr:unnamed protein product [Rotaria sordida]
MAPSLKSPCICITNFPYDKPTDKRSLQNAIHYSVNRFLNKSSTTKKIWSIILDPDYSLLSSSEQHKRINYTIYDCLAVIFPYRAIYEEWWLIKLRGAELISLFISNASSHSSSLPLSTFLENIFEDESEEDDEVIVSFLSSQLVSGGDIINPVSSNQHLSSDEQTQPRRTRNSAAARTRPSRKHNKKATLVDLYFDRLPGDLFDMEHYQRYCRHAH